MDRAKAEGPALVGPDGVLTGLTRTVLGAGVEAELTEHLGYDKHAPKAVMEATPPTAHARRRW